MTTELGAAAPSGAPSIPLERLHGQLLASVQQAVIATDLQGRVIAWNRYAETLYGWSAEEAVGRSITELLVLEADASEAAMLMAQVASGGSWQGRFQVRRRDGSVFPALVTDSPLRDEKGRIVGIVGVSVDVTALEDTREALERSEQRLRRVVESAPDGVFIACEGRILWANEAMVRLAGLQCRDELLDRDCADFFAPDDRERAKRIRTAASVGARVGPEELRMRLPDGAELMVETVAIPFAVDGGAPGTLSFVRDVTERKRLQAQLMIADRVVSSGTLAAGIAHEINNPLSFASANLGYVSAQVDKLRGFVAEARAGDLDALARLEAELAECGQALSDAAEGTRRVQEIVGDLKAFSRPGQERRERIDLRRVVERSLSVTQHELRTRATIVRDLAGPAMVEGIENRLGQVLVNLLINAAQAIPPGRPAENRIRVGLASEGGEVRVEVSDTGCGIPAENLHRIFDPFFSTKPVGEGTGLGLSICHRIVTDADGTIEVESVPGAGTTVRLRFPAAGA